MKKFYSIFLAMLAGLLGMSMQAKDITVIVTEGSSVIYSQPYEDDFTPIVLGPGTYNYTFEGWVTHRFEPVSGHTMTKAIYNDGANRKDESDFKNKAYVDFYASTFTDPKKGEVTFTTRPTAELENKSVTINIDEVPLGLKCSFVRSGKQISLKPGANTVSYVPETDGSTVKLEMTNQQAIYSVSLNGNKQNSSYIHNLVVSDGSVIDIITKVPDEECTVTLVYEDQDNFWTSIVVNGSPVTVTNNQFKAKATSKVELYNRKGKSWYIEYIKTPRMTYTGDYVGYPYQWQYEEYPLDFIVEGDCQVIVKAHLIQDYNITFNVTGADRVRVMQGDNDHGTEISLQEGVNNVLLREDNTRVAIIPRNEESFLAPVTYKSSPDAPLLEAYYMESMGYYSIAKGILKDGAVINIVARDTPMTFKMTVNVDSPEDVALYSFYDAAGYYDNVPVGGKLVKGENTINFPENSSKLYVVPATIDSQISSVTYRANASAQPTVIAREEWYNYYLVTAPVAGSVVDIKATHITYDSNALVYVDNAEISAQGVELISDAGRKIPLATGYNRVRFNAEENAADGLTLHTLSAEGNFTVFVNNNKLTTADADNRTARVKLADGDIVKLYLEPANPAPVNVAFSQEGNVKASEVKVDLDTPVENVDAPLSLLPGTMITFKAGSADGTIVPVVNYNGEAVKVDAETGTYNVGAVARSTVELGEAKLFVKGRRLSAPVELTYADGVYSATLPKLENYFTIADETDSFMLGGVDGTPVELNEAYTPVLFSTSGMILADESAADVRLTYNHAKGTVTVTDTNGIEMVETAATGAGAWFDLQGRKVSADRLKAGIYIHVGADGKASKVAVK